MEYFSSSMTGLHRVNYEGAKWNIAKLKKKNELCFRMYNIKEENTQTDTPTHVSCRNY